MRLKVEFLTEKKVNLPVGYNEYIQGLIYDHLKPEDSEWLHEQGFLHENRAFKLFTFSSILERGRYDKKNKTFEYPGQVSLLISSPVEWILKQLAENLISGEFVMLGNNRLTVSSINILKPRAIAENSVKVKAVTPIEVHSTFTLENGKKRTHYYTPFDKDFSELVNANLKKKWKAFYKEECQYNISMEPLFRGSRNEKIRYFGGGENKTLIKGWMGYFKLEGEPDILNFAVDAGLGSRNSQGFGMVEVVG